MSIDKAEANRQYGPFGTYTYTYNSALAACITAYGQLAYILGLPF